MIRDGVTYEVGDPSQKTVEKYSTSNYKLHTDALTMELQDGDVLVISGKFTGGRTDLEETYAFSVTTTYITIVSVTNGEISFSMTAPTEPEPDNPTEPEPTEPETTEPETTEPENTEFTENHVLALRVDVLDENSPMNLITREAYPGGSTVSFKAYVPENATWWAVSWTTDPTDVSLYQWTEGKGLSMTSKVEEWADYSVTLPDDGNTYYVYFVGAKGEWSGSALLLDDVVITAPDGTQVMEDFESGLDSSRLLAISVGNSAVELQTVEISSANSGATDNHVAALYVDVLDENSPMNLITREAFPGGSTVSFKAYVPENATWWAVSWTTDPTDVSLYKWYEEGMGESMTSQTGKWAEYSVTLPDDGNTYYVYIVGEKGQWKGNALLLDDVVITAPDGTVYTEDFEKGFDDCLFSVTAQTGAHTIVELKTEETSV